MDGRLAPCFHGSLILNTSFSLRYGKPVLHGQRAIYR